MICTNCGKEMPGGAAVCPFCGTRVGDERHWYLVENGAAVDLTESALIARIKAGTVTPASKICIRGATAWSDAGETEMAPYFAKPQPVQVPATVMLSNQEEPATEPEPIEEPEAIAEPVAVAEPEPVEEPESIEEPEAVEEPEPIAEPEPIEEPESVAEPVAVAEPEPVAAAQPIGAEAPKADLEKPVSLGSWVGLELLMAIPVVNFVLAIILMCCKRVRRSIRNYAGLKLLLMGLAVMAAFGVVIFFMVGGMYLIEGIVDSIRDQFTFYFN